MKLRYSPHIVLALSTLTLCVGPSASYPLAPALFPSGYAYFLGFTTAPGVSVPGVERFPLAEEPLGISRVPTEPLHEVANVGGKTAWQADYPAGSLEPAGGLGFTVHGPSGFYSFLGGGAREVLFSYSVLFQEGWQWGSRGKLPGAFGGPNDLTYNCPDARQSCFNLHPTWRERGVGELNSYLPITARNRAAQLAVPPLSIEDLTNGFSVGRGAFSFPAGQWTTIAQRVKLNQPTAYDGEVQVWVDGRKAIDLRGVSLRNSSATLLHGLLFHTFFGSASPKNQTAWFADISGAIITGRA